MNVINNDVDKKFIKNKKIWGTITGIFFFVLVILGATYAWFLLKSDDIDIGATTASFVIEYNDDTGAGAAISGDLFPTTDRTKGLHTWVNINKTEASLEGTASLTLNITSLTLTGICSNTSYTTSSSCTSNGGTWTQADPAKLHYAVYSGGSCSNNTYITPSTCETNSGTWTPNFLVDNSGTFAGKTNGSTIALLSNVPLTSTETRYYVYIWLDETADNKYLGSNITGNISASATQNDLNVPNAPMLANGMIPIKYDGNNWVKAKITNTSNDWYDYDDKMWANAVTINNNVILDKSNNSNYGAIYGSPTINNKEMTLDGVDDYIHLGYANYALNNQFTMITRIKINAPSVAVQSIFGNWEAAGIGFEYGIDKKMRFYSFDNTTSSYKVVVSSTTYESGSWHTFVGRYDGTNLTLWVDGSIVSTLQVSITQKISVQPYLIGANPDGSSRSSYTNATISDAFLYDSALSNSNIINYFSGEINNYPNSAEDAMVFGYNDFSSVPARTIFMNAEAGTIIPENAILSYYTWIPRYKYQLFNPTYTSGTSPQLINVVFESGTSTTGTVTCTYSELGAETCINKAVGNYYTHPAFTFGSGELTGIWVGKFETTGTSTIPTIKPTMTTLTNQNVSTQFATAKILGTNTYLTDNGVGQTDSHMMKNIEWGAVTYLKQSAYGLGTINIGKNNYYHSRYYYITGCGATPDSSISTGCNRYKTTNGMLASTTGNITGIYDMSGGTWENVMGNYQKYSGYTAISYTAEQAASILGRTDNIAVGISNSGFNGPVYGKALDGVTSISYTNGVPFPESKYYDLYAGSNRTYSHLGDALGETVSWYDDTPNQIGGDYPWFVRGNSSEGGINAGLFASGGAYGVARNYLGFRSVLVLQ